MRMLAVAILVAAACGGSKPPAEDDTLPDPGSGGPGGVEIGGDGEATTELERRQHAACERVIPRLTACAVEDARRALTPEEFEKNQIELVAPIHTRENLKACKAATMSSRQVRVYEVCDREETECAPLVACLEHAKPQPAE